MSSFRDTLSALIDEYDEVKDRDLLINEICKEAGLCQTAMCIICLKSMEGAIKC